MKVLQLGIENFRGIKNAKIDFDSHVTILLGKNGSGKSSLIDATAALLSWVVARLRSESGRGSWIEDNDIRNGANSSEIQLVCSGLGLAEEFEFSMNKARKGSSTGRASQWSSLNERGKWIRAALTTGEIDSLPVLAFYPVSRAVLDIPLRIRVEHRFRPIDAYESAMQGSANFRVFFEWFRNREDLENETRLNDGNLEFRDHQLKAVRSAIEHFMPSFSSLSVKRSPLRMEIKKEGARLLINQLSVGEKCLLAMIGDLARRLAIANPNLSNPLLGNGVILIDEIDLHLHPHWQRTTIRNLVNVFPNCQFIVSTHSPQIIGELAPKHLRILRIDADGKFQSSIPESSLGLDSAEILETIMDTDVRNHEVDIALGKIFLSIDKEEFSQAKQMVEQLKLQLNGSIPELVRAETMIAVLEP